MNSNKHLFTFSRNVGRVKNLSCKLLLLVFVCFGRWHIAFCEPKKHRPSFLRQIALKCLPNRIKRRSFCRFNPYQSTACLALILVQRNTINRAFLYIGCPDGRFNQRGTNIFTLPAKSITNSINEIDMAVSVSLHQITGPEIFVAPLEHVLQYLLFGFVLVRIPIEALRWIARCNHSNKFTNFVWLTFHACTPRIAVWLASFIVKS